VSGKGMSVASIGLERGDSTHGARLTVTGPGYGGDDVGWRVMGETRLGGRVQRGSASKEASSFQLALLCDVSAIYPERGYADRSDGRRRSIANLIGSISPSRGLRGRGTRVAAAAGMRKRRGLLRYVTRSKPNCDPMAVRRGSTGSVAWYMTCSGRPP
jgi:hypothetical protein